MEIDGHVSSFRGSWYFDVVDVMGAWMCEPNFKKFHWTVFIRIAISFCPQMPENTLQEN